MWTTFAERLKEARTHAGLSQSELARRVGVTPSAIQLMESGVTQRSRYLVKIANAVNVRPEWLETGEEPRSREPQFDVSERLKYLADSSTTSPPTKLRSSVAVANGPIFRPGEIHYDPDYLPVYLTAPTTVMRRREQQTIDSLVSDVEKLNLRIEGDESAAKSLIVSVCLQSLNRSVPDEHTQRPHYLIGVEDSYAIYQMIAFSLDARLSGREILHISPNGEPRHRDIVIVWTENMSLIVGEYRLTDDGLPYVLLPSNHVWKSVIFGLKPGAVRAVHSVVGLEYANARFQTQVAGQDAGHDL